MWDDVVVSTAVVAVAFSLYVSVMHPSVADADNAEFMAKAKLFVNPHAPGYPLLLVLSRLWNAAGERGLFGSSLQHDPLRNFNMLNVLLSALSLGVLYYVCRLCGCRRGASIAAVGLFGFAPHLRTYATQLEVFSLNHLLIGLVIVAALKFDCALGYPKCINADVVANRVFFMWPCNEQSAHIGPIHVAHRHMGCCTLAGSLAAHHRMCGVHHTWVISLPCLGCHNDQSTGTDHGKRRDR